MKMPKIILVSLLLCLIGSEAFSQAPGYRGMNLGVYYEGFLGPAISYPNAKFNRLDLGNTYSENLNLFALNYRNVIGVEYSVSRKQMLGAALHFYKTSTFLGQRFIYEGPPFSAGQRVEVEPLDRYINISGKNFELFYKVSLKEYIAPIGAYTKISLLGMSAHALVDDSTFVAKTSSFGGGSSFNLTFNETRFFYPAIGYEAGGTRVIFDRVEIRLGFQVILTAANIFYSLDELYYKPEASETFLKPALGDRLFHMHLINLKLGIGFLAI